MTGKIGDDAERWCWPLDDAGCDYICGNKTACIVNVGADTIDCTDALASAPNAVIIETQCNANYWCSYDDDYYYPYGYSSWNSYCYNWTPWAVALGTIISLLLIGACICLCIMWSRGAANVDETPPDVRKKEVMMQPIPAQKQNVVPPSEQPAKRRLSDDSTLKQPEPMTRNQQAMANQPQNSYAPTGDQDKSNAPSAQVSDHGAQGSDVDFDPMSYEVANGTPVMYGEVQAQASYPEIKPPTASV
jgi:hypothetical protein